MHWSSVHQSLDMDLRLSQWVLYRLFLPKYHFHRNSGAELLLPHPWPESSGKCKTSIDLQRGIFEFNQFKMQQGRYVQAGTRSRLVMYPPQVLGGSFSTDSYPMHRWKASLIKWLQEFCEHKVIHSYIDHITQRLLCINGKKNPA